MEQKWLIAGHSSGAALAIELYKKIKTLDAKIKLATLDGFVPPKYLMNNNTKCWRSVSRINNLKSYNYDSQNNCSQLGELDSPECGNSMCLHFALINKTSAKNKTDFKNYSTVGYKALDPELVWVEF